MGIDEWLNNRGIKPVYLVIAYIILLFSIGCVLHLLNE